MNHGKVRDIHGINFFNFLKIDWLNGTHLTHLNRDPVPALLTCVSSQSFQAILSTSLKDIVFFVAQLKKLGTHTH